MGSDIRNENKDLTVCCRFTKAYNDHHPFYFLQLIRSQYVLGRRHKARDMAVQHAVFSVPACGCFDPFSYGFAFSILMHQPLFEMDKFNKSPLLIFSSIRPGSTRHSCFSFNSMSLRVIVPMIFFPSLGGEKMEKILKELRKRFP